MEKGNLELQVKQVTNLANMKKREFLRIAATASVLPAIPGVGFTSVSGEDPIALKQ
jgi:hypothetical protein